MMKRIGVIIGLFICLSACQEEAIRPEEARDRFIKYYGGANQQTGMDLAATADGGFALLGSTSSTDEPSTGGDNLDMYLVKTDAFGDAQASVRFDGAEGKDDMGVSLEVLTDGFLLLGNTTNQDGFSNLWLIRTDLQGGVQWEQQMGEAGANEYASEVAVTSNGEIIVLATTSAVDVHKPAGFLPDTDLNDFMLAKISPSGGLVWSRTFGYTGSDQAAALTLLPNDEIAILGTTDFGNALTGGSDMALTVTNAFGIPIRTRLLGESGERETAADLIINSQGDLVATGNRGEGTAAQPILIKTDLQLSPSSTETFLVGAPSSSVSGLAETGDGGFIICGSTGQEGMQDYFLYRLNPDITEVWTASFGGPGHDKGAAVLSLEEGGFAFTGTLSFGNNTVISLIKTDASGQLNP